MSPFENGPGIHLPAEAASRQLNCRRHVVPGTCLGLGKPWLPKSSDGSPGLATFDESGMIILFIKEICFDRCCHFKIYSNSRGSQTFQIASHFPKPENGNGGGRYKLIQAHSLLSAALGLRIQNLVGGGY